MASTYYVTQIKPGLHNIFCAPAERLLQIIKANKRVVIKAGRERNGTEPIGVCASFFSILNPIDLVSTSGFTLDPILQP